MGLQTHNVDLTSPVADLIVALGPNGLATVGDSIETALRDDPALRADVREAEESLRKQEGVVDPKPATSTKDLKAYGQLINEETFDTGGVASNACEYSYLGSALCRRATMR